MLEWLSDHRGMVAMAGASMLLALVAPLIAMIVVVRIPADALEKGHRGGSKPLPAHPAAMAAVVP